jgi:RTX calcium-binding nonapeptide repeat (4 copies)
MPRILVFAVVCIAAAIAVPSVAQGATVYHEGRPASGLLVQADPGETNLVSVKGSMFLEIRDDGTPLKLAREGACKRLDAHAVRCRPLHRLDLDLEDGPDVAVIDTPHPLSVEGGAGPDRYVATTTAAPSRVDFEGGTGLDVANYFYANAGVRVGIDLSDGDGRPGDDDHIRRDVESVIGSAFADAITGSHHAERLSGGDGDDEIAGGAGEDVLSGGDGNDRVDARDGGPDTIDCGGQLLDWAAVDVGIDTSLAGCAEVVGP